MTKKEIKFLKKIKNLKKINELQSNTLAELYQIIGQIWIKIGENSLKDLKEESVLKVMDNIIDVLENKKPRNEILPWQ